MTQNGGSLALEGGELRAAGEDAEDTQEWDPFALPADTVAWPKQWWLKCGRPSGEVHLSPTYRDGMVAYIMRTKRGRCTVSFYGPEDWRAAFCCRGDCSTAEMLAFVPSGTTEGFSAAPNVDVQRRRPTEEEWLTPTSSR